MHVCLTPFVCVWCTRLAVCAPAAGLFRCRWPCLLFVCERVLFKARIDVCISFGLSRKYTYHSPCICHETAHTFIRVPSRILLHIGFRHLNGAPNGSSINRTSINPRIHFMPQLEENSCLIIQFWVSRRLEWHVSCLVWITFRYPFRSGSHEWIRLHQVRSNNSKRRMAIMIIRFVINSYTNPNWRRCFFLLSYHIPFFMRRSFPNSKTDMNFSVWNRKNALRRSRWQCKIDRTEGNEFVVISALVRLWSDGRWLRSNRGRACSVSCPRRRA